MIWNSSESWGWPARTFHWVIALMIFIQVALGLWMDDGPPRAERPFYIGIHASLGISILALMIVRFGWWLINSSPAQPAGTPPWQRTTARIVHWALYLVTFATVLAGWMLVGSHDHPVAVRMFGLIEVPQLVSPGSPLHEPLEETHVALALTLITLVGVHMGAALYHQLVLRDNVMRRMVRG